MNPITQRSNTTGQQNGAGPQTKIRQKSSGQNADSADKIANERLVFLLGNSMVISQPQAGAGNRLIQHHRVALHQSLLRRVIFFLGFFLGLNWRTSLHTC